MAVVVATPPVLTHAEMQERFRGGPVMQKGWVMALVGGRIYKRDGDGNWYRLDDTPRATVKELIDGSS